MGEQGRPRGLTVAKGSWRAQNRRRILGLYGALLLAGLALVVQLARLQFVSPQRYVTWGEEQRRQVVSLPGLRGDLLDRNGEELAISVIQPTIVADPALIEDPTAAADLLAPLLGRTPADLEATLASPTRFEYLARAVSPEVADQVRALGLTGIFFQEEPARFGPAGEQLARSVLGTVNIDQVGATGLELQYDDELAGIPGSLITETGVDGQTIPVGHRQLTEPSDGRSLVLTLDRALQFQVEQSLLAYIDTVCAQSGVVVIMEPTTGDILAMATVVRDDAGIASITAENRAVTWVYEPASVMKPFTFAGLLDQDLLTPATPRWVPGSVTIYDDTFADEPVHGGKSLTAAEILTVSSNVGTILWAEDLGADSLHRYLRTFGFGSSSGLAFPGESAGLFPEREDWTGTSLATIALGQGIAVTPLQLLTAYNTIANGGSHVAPRLVSAIVDSDGEQEAMAPDAAQPVVSASAAATLTDMLQGVVENGTAHRAAVPGYEVAAKTGTARKVQANGGYEDALGGYHYVATVAGFFPADEPALSMVVLVDEPCGSIFASQVAAPLFGELASWALRHFQIPPTTEIRSVASRPTDEAPLAAGAGWPAGTAPTPATDRG